MTLLGLAMIVFLLLGAAILFLEWRDASYHRREARRDTREATRDTREDRRDDRHVDRQHGGTA